MATYPLFEPVSGELVVECVGNVGSEAYGTAAVASVGQHLCLAWCERWKHKINIAWSSDCRHFTGWRELPFSSNLPGGEGGLLGQQPALAVLDGQLVLAWPYADRNAGFLRRGGDRYPAVMFGSEHDMVVAGRSKAARGGAGIAVTTWQGRIVVAWRCSGPRLGSSLMTAQVLGRTFGEPVKMDSVGGLSGMQGASVSAVCSMAEELYFAWAHEKIGVGPCTRVVSTRNDTYQAPLVFPRVSHLQMCELGGELAVAWREKRNICVGFLRSGELVPALRLRLRAGWSWGGSAVGLCAHDDGLVLTWGADMNVARIRRARR